LCGLPFCKDNDSLQTAGLPSKCSLSSSSNIMNTPGTRRSMRHCSHKEILVPVEDAHSAKSEVALPAVPSAPTLKPQRLSSFVSKSSWRLSFASENRGTHLRSLSQNGSPTPHGKDVSNLQPINRWLRNYGLRSTSQALTWSDSSSTRASSASHSRTRSTHHDNKHEIPYAGVHLQDMILSQQLVAHLQSSVPRQQVSNAEDRSNCHCPSHTAGVGKIGRITQDLSSIGSGFLYTADKHASSNTLDTELLRERPASTVVSHTLLNVNTVDRSKILDFKEPQDAKTQTTLSQHSGSKAPSEPAISAGLLTESFDGSLERGLPIPLPPSPMTITPYADRGDKPTSRIHHLVDDEVAGAWKRAVYLSVHSKDMDISKKLMVPESNKILGSWDGRKKNRINDKLSTRNAEPRSIRTRDRLEEEKPGTSNKPLLERGGYFETWEKALDRAKQRAKTTLHKSTPNPRYPAPRSKYSSHDRRERGGSTGADDHVERVDFAIAGVQGEETVWHIDERPNHLYNYEDNDHGSHRDASKRGSVQTNIFLDRTGGRSLIPSPPVEYPELKLLLGDIMTAAQIEAYVDVRLKERGTQKQTEELKPLLSTEIKRHGSAFSGKWESRRKEADYSTEKQQSGLGSIELDNPTPTKGIAERTEARNSRSKAGNKSILPRSSMIAKGRANKKEIKDLSRDQPQSPFQANVNMSIGKSRQEPTKEGIAKCERNTNITESLKYYSHPCEASTNSVHEEYRKESEVAVEYSGFYEDCIVIPGRGDIDCEDDTPPKCLEMDVFGTWSPGGLEESRDNAEERSTPMRPLRFGHLRKSTDDFHLELQKMEKLEREKALRIAKEAWGSGS
jgi:hypothetical protein